MFETRNQISKTWFGTKFETLSKVSKTWIKNPSIGQEKRRVRQCHLFFSFRKAQLRVHIVRDRCVWPSRFDRTQLHWAEWKFYDYCRRLGIELARKKGMERREGWPELFLLYNKLRVCHVIRWHMPRQFLCRRWRQITTFTFTVHYRLILVMTLHSSLPNKLTLHTDFLAFYKYPYQSKIQLQYQYF